MIPSVRAVCASSLPCFDRLLRFALTSHMGDRSAHDAAGAKDDSDPRLPPKVKSVAETRAPFEMNTAAHITLPPKTSKELDKSDGPADGGAAASQTPAMAEASALDDDSAKETEPSGFRFSEAPVPILSLTELLGDAQAAAASTVYIRHLKSGMFIHPQDHKATSGSLLVMYPALAGPSSPFCFRSDGNLQHEASGLFVHPLGGIAKSCVALILHPDGPDSRLAFDFDGNGCLRHRDSGLYVHPANGRGVEGEGLMLDPDGPDRAVPGEIVFSLETKVPQQKRSTLAHLVEEILRTELDFQDNLRFTICKPLYFLQDFVLQRGFDIGFGEHDIELLKCNLQEICNCSVSFFEKLESANSASSTGMPLLFGHVFHSFIPRFVHLYSRYCANFEEHAVVLLHKLSEANVMERLPANHIQELEDSKEWCMSGRSLQSLLIKPVQRLPRYELLLRELRRLTPSDHEDSENLDLSLEFMKDCNEQINTAIGGAKRRARSRFLDALLMSRPSYAACKMPPLVPPKRSGTDIWFGCVRITAQTYVNAAAGPEIIYCMTRKLLLLSDRLVFIGKETREDWRVTAVFPLRSVWLNAEEEHPCLFVMTCDDGGCDHDGRVPDGIYQLTIESIGNSDDDFEVPGLENSAPSALWPQLQFALTQWVSSNDKSIDIDDAYVEDLAVRSSSAKFVEQTRMWKDFSFDTGVRALPISPSLQLRCKTLLWLDDRPDREDNVRIRMRIPGARWFDELELVENRSVSLMPESGGKGSAVGAIAAMRLVGAAGDSSAVSVLNKDALRLENNSKADVVTAVRIAGAAGDLSSINGVYIPTGENHCQKPVYRKSDGDEDELMWIEYDEARRQWQVKDTAHRGNGGWSLASITSVGKLEDSQSNGGFWKTAVSASVSKPDRLSYKLNQAATDATAGSPPLKREEQVDVTLFLSVAAMIDFLSDSAQAKFAKSPPSLFRIISNRRLFLGTVPVFCCSKSEFLCDGVSGLLSVGDAISFEGSSIFGGVSAGATYYLSAVRRSKNKEFFSVSKDKGGASISLVPCALQADSSQGPRMTLRASRHSLLHFFESSDVWKYSFPATCIFHGGGAIDELRRRPNLFLTSAEAECYSFVAFEHMASIQ